MTQEYLESFLHRGRLIEVKSRELQMIYDTRRSIPTDFISGQSNSFGKSSVERALDRIDSITKDLEREIILYAEELDQIESWLNEYVSDPLISAIIRSRYLCGDSWQKTSWVCFRSTNKSTSQMAFRRYVQTHNIFEEQE